MVVDTQNVENVRGEGLRVFYDAGGTAGEDVACVTCGYGVSVRTLLPPCPMCGGRVWERARMSGLARSER